MNRSLRDIIVGALIGAVSMLPGASGGIIAVVILAVAVLAFVIIKKKNGTI